MSSTSKKPNFLIIVADDMGYSDTEPFGSEIKTPALNRLANSGIRLTNFHTASACSPTRSMLFSGTDNHIAGVGQMAEHMTEHPVFKDKPGYEGYLNFRVAALSEILQDNGYHTIMSGKWHLGLSSETSPHARGFDTAFAYLSGCHNHYNFEPQLEEPAHALTAAVQGAKFWMENDKFIDRKSLPEDFYSSDFFATNLIEYLKEHKSERGEQPFFAYLPFTAPHWPLQAPQSVIEKYRGMYDDGPDALKQRRLDQMIKLGLIRPDVESAPMVGVLGKPWSEQSETERAESARKMEVFAAMIDLIDVNIGRVIDHLDATGELDNTFVLFMSDNGAEGALLEALPVMGGSANLHAILDKYYDNSMSNMGNSDSYIWYGPAWACASMAPSRGFKKWITEGGIRCPCIVRYPPLHQGKGDSITESFATVMDIMPTILDLAGVKHPGTRFRGRDVALLRGKTWVPHLKGEAPGFHDEEQVITGWELFGCRAIRRGKWKALWQPPPRGKGDWELYEVTKDEGELHDKADDKPEILRELVGHWETYYAETGMVDAGDDFVFKSITQG